MVSARNPVHSMLFPIASFFSAAGLFVLLGRSSSRCCWSSCTSRAVAVLFLFVVMMLDVDFAALRRGFARYLPLGGAVCRRSDGRDGHRRHHCGQPGAASANAALQRRPM